MRARTIWNRQLWSWFWLVLLSVDAVRSNAWSLVPWAVFQATTLRNSPLSGLFEAGSVQERRMFGALAAVRASSVAGALTVLIVLVADRYYWSTAALVLIVASELLPRVRGRGTLFAVFAEPLAVPGALYDAAAFRHTWRRRDAVADAYRLGALRVYRPDDPMPPNGVMYVIDRNGFQMVRCISNGAWSAVAPDVASSSQGMQVLADITVEAGCAGDTRELAELVRRGRALIGSQALVIQVSRRLRGRWVPPDLSATETTMVWRFAGTTRATAIQSSPDRPRRRREAEEAPVPHERFAGWRPLPSPA